MNPSNRESLVRHMRKLTLNGEIYLIKKGGLHKTINSRGSKKYIEKKIVKCYFKILHILVFKIHCTPLSISTSQSAFDMLKLRPALVNFGSRSLLSRFWLLKPTFVISTLKVCIPDLCFAKPTLHYPLAFAACSLSISALKVYSPDFGFVKPALPLSFGSHSLLSLDFPS